MRVHCVIPVSLVNGPGRRFAIWTQGCLRRCPGCFNPLTHPKEGGFELPVSDIMKEIPYKEVEGISVSGGEPFEQAEELLELLCLSKAAGLSRLVYTGFKYEELTGKEESRIREILSLTDILIDGAYEEESAVDELWAGSANQRALELKEGNIAGFYNLTKKEEDAGCEIIIDKEGCILVTGIVKSAFTIVE